MNILLICNNYDSTRDGIGKYAKLISDELKRREEVENVFCATGYTNDSNKLKMLLSLQMSRAMLKANSLLGKHRIEIVMLEYPFQEYNPLIVLMYSFLKQKCHKRNIKLVLSIHEYRRANRLRKKVIDFMAERADIVLVSDADSQRELLKKNKKIFLRNMIGTVFPGETPILENKKEEFLYFGLINRSKAFKEMLEAWKIFNADEKKKLTIISSTEFEEEIIPGVEIKRNLPEKEVSEYLERARYMILPILPEITAVNGTFKTAALFGCICIGHFCDNLRTMEFTVESKNYEPECLAGNLEKAYQLSEMEKEIMFEKAREYGKAYSPKAAADELMKLLY